MSALEWFPPVPVPPTREEMEDAILAFAAEWWNVDQANGSPADLAILGLAERLAAVREHAKAHPVVTVPAVCQGCVDGTIDNHIYGHGESAAETPNAAILGAQCPTEVFPAAEANQP